jgi:hypothetical protein
MDEQVTPRMEIVMHLLWIPPALVFALLPLYEVDGIHYDNSGTHHTHTDLMLESDVASPRTTAGWCWVGEHPTYARFVASYMWVWLVIISIMCLYYSIFSHMRRGSCLHAHYAAHSLASCARL